MRDLTLHHRGVPNGQGHDRTTKGCGNELAATDRPTKGSARPEAKYTRLRRLIATNESGAR